MAVLGLAAVTVYCSAYLHSTIQVDDKLSLTPVARQYDRAGGSSSQLFGAGAFTQDGQRQRSQVHTHLCLSSSHAALACISLNSQQARSVSWCKHFQHVHQGQAEEGTVHVDK